MVAEVQSSPSRGNESEPGVIEVNHLRKVYSSGIIFRKRFEALKDVSLSIRPGEVFGLLGPNGAGKTTLIKTLLGIIRPSGGNASVLGKSVGSMAARMRIGYLPENLNISKVLTGVEALRFYARLNRVPEKLIRQREEGVLKQVGLLGRHTDRIGGYSKGMRQRVGLAQAMIHEPEILIMDEPTDGLDPVGRSEIRQIIEELKNQGKTIFLNSHILQEVEMVCDRVAILVAGNVLGVGTMEELVDGMVEKSGQTGIRVHFNLRGDLAQIQQIVCQQMAVDSVGELPESCSIVLKNTDSQANQTSADVFLYAQSQSEIDMLVDRFRQQAVSIFRLDVTRPKLEDVFFSVVQSAEAKSNPFSESIINTPVSGGTL
jgi:ABC-2 type transport system ATP-binding protein